MALDTSKVKLPVSVVNEMVAKASDVSTIVALSPAVPQLFSDSQHMLFMPSAEGEVVAEVKGSLVRIQSTRPARIRGRRLCGPYLYFMS